MTGLIRRHVTFLLAVFACAVFASATPVFAQEAKSFVAKANGAIVEQAFCSAIEVCQTAVVSGTATRLGTLVGELHERVNITNGQYTGHGLFTLGNGDTISTEYVGQVTPPDENGGVRFFEHFAVVDATGRLAGMTGSMEVQGSADAAGNISIEGTGVLIR